MWESEVLSGLTLKGLAVEGKAGASAWIGKEGVRAKADFEAGAYLGKMQYAADLAGFGVAAEGYISANVQGQGRAIFDLEKGAFGAGVEMGAFVGGRLDGSVARSLDLAGIEVDLEARGSIS